MNKKLLIIIFLLPLICSSCLKRYGCRDSDAINYDANSTNNNFRCVYEASGSVWWDDMDAAQMSADGISQLSVYFDDELIGTMGVDQYLSSSPNCANYGGITFSKREIFSDPWKVAITVRDQNGQDILNSYFALYPDNCNFYQIEY